MQFTARTSAPALAFALVFFVVSFWCFLVLDDAAASSGRVAADGCHEKRGDAYPHYHVDGTRLRAGTCARGRDGRTIYRPDKPSKKQLEEHNKALEMRIRGQAHELKLLRFYKKATQAQVEETKRILFKDEIAKVEKAEARAAAAVKDAKAARSAERNAWRKVGIAENLARLARAEAARERNAAREAEARARGKGPRVDSHCKNAVKMFVLDKRTAFFSSSVKVNKDERAALRRACIDKVFR